VWGSADYTTNVVEVTVSAVRRKLESHGTRVIHTVQGVGYVLRPQEAAPERALAELMARRDRLVRDRDRLLGERSAITGPAERPSG
jgi:DNA-binding winged helix-turn-helix (wHTH) protein